MVTRRFGGPRDLEVAAHANMIVYDPQGDELTRPQAL
jgi:hypothetical protein